MIRRFWQWVMHLFNETRLVAFAQGAYALFSHDGRFLRLVRSGFFDPSKEEYVPVDLVYRQCGDCRVGDLCVFFSWTLRIDESVVVSRLALSGRGGAGELSSITQKMMFFYLFQDALYDLLAIDNGTAFRMFHVMEKQQLTDLVRERFCEVLKAHPLCPKVVDLDIHSICFWA